MASRCKPPVYHPVKFSDFGDILTAQQVAQILHCQTESINRLCRKGEIPEATKFGNTWHIPKEVIMKRFGITQ